MVPFDRSWYNRAGVERVMGFRTDDEFAELMATVNGFELALVRSGTILIKYWLDIADETQETRFRERIDDRRKRWKLSPMDLEARSRWVDYSRARDTMLLMTNTPPPRGTSSTRTSNPMPVCAPSHTCSSPSPGRRSQCIRINWARMRRRATRWLPRARVVQPFPTERFEARTQGRSPRTPRHHVRALRNF